MMLPSLILILIWTVVADAIPYDVCDVYDGTHGIPIGAGRTCTVLKDDTCGSSYSHKTTTLNCRIVQSECDPSCPGFVGMKLTFKCSFQGARLYRFKDGTYFYLNESFVNYDLLLPEHAGLYECRNSSNIAVYSQNITVNEKIRIGSVDNSCTDFARYTSHSCCKSSSAWPALNENSCRQYTVYGDPADVKVTVEQLEWLVDKETRNDVDIGLYAERDENNPVIWRIMFKRIPLHLTPHIPRILFRVIADDTGSNSSHAICDTIEFDNTNFYIKIDDMSLPTNHTVSEGEDALFQCSFSYLKQNWVTAYASSFNVQFAFSTINSFCTGWHTLSGNRNDTNCSLAVVTKDEDPQHALFGTEIYTFRIPRVTANLNRSAIIVSLTHSDIIHDYYDGVTVQWKKVAWLTVLPAREVETPLVTNILVPILVVIIVIGSIIMIIAWIIKKKRKYLRITVNKDTVSLNSYEENTFGYGFKCNRESLQNDS